jgi:hypothetical protein
MEIKLDGTAVAELASAAIFQSLSEQQRESVLKQAVEALLTPDKNHHSTAYGKTALQQAFEQAIRQAAYNAVHEKIAQDPEVRAKIDELLGPLLLAAVDAESSEYRDSLADAIGNAIGGWLAAKARGE